jgi:competence protein ComEC
MLWHLILCVTFGTSSPTVPLRWHADSDHYNGLSDLLDRFVIRLVRVPPGFDGPTNPGAKRLLDDVRARGIPVETIARGARIDLGGTTLTAIHPPALLETGSTDNARSVVLEVASMGRRLLLTGDLEANGLFEVVAHPIEPLEAMLAPHHGGRTSNPAWLYAWAKPDLVIVSQRNLAAGSRDPLTPLAEGHFPLLRTWQSGAVLLRWSATGLLATGFLDAIEPAQPARPPVESSGWKILAAILGLSIGASVCLAITVVEWGAWSLVMPGRRLSKKTSPGEASGQAVHATASDGTRLAGTWFASDRAEGRTILLLHGLAEDHTALLGRVPALLRRGWNVAALDSRASGESNGRRASFGAREADDLIAWLKALAPLAGPAPTFAAWGRSMGATIALKAAAIDPRIKALVLEAPYRDLKSPVATILRRLRIPLSGAFARLILLRARTLAGVSLDRPRPTDLAAQVHARVLILHGSNDLIAPIADAIGLANAFPVPAQILEVAGAGHANVVGIGGDGLMDQIGEFLNEAT